jgi:lipopolysaccharide export LptBFGC system permease protein LptF
LALRLQKCGPPGALKLLHQYILRQFLCYLALSVAFLAAVLVAGNVLKGMMDLLVSGKLSVGDCAALMAMLLPPMASHALPFGFVAATLLTVGGMAADREFLALRSSGVGPLKMFSSILFLASCGVLLSLAVNFHCAPRAISAVKTRIQNIIREEPLRFIAAQKFVRDFPGYIFFVKEIVNDRLNDFHIWELDDREQVASYIHAERGTCVYDASRHILVLTLERGTIEKQLGEGKISPLVSFERLSLDLKWENIFGTMVKPKKIRHMTLRELLILREESVKKRDRATYMAVQVELQMKGAMAFAILVLVLVALPLSVKLERREASLNVALALLLCVIYFFLMMILSFLETKPHIHPDLILWIPNILLQILGTCLYRKLCRR